MVLGNNTLMYNDNEMAANHRPYENTGLWQLTLN